MTLLEKIQQYDDKQYAVDDKAEEVARPKNEWEIAAAAMYNSLFDFREDDVQSKLASSVITNIQPHKSEFYLPGTVLSTIIEKKLNP